MLNCNDTCNNKTKELHIVLNHKLNEFHMLANAIIAPYFPFIFRLEIIWNTRLGCR